MAKLMKLTVLCFIAMPLIAQEGEAVQYRYLVPLPGTKNIGIADWEYTLELVSRNGEAFTLELQQYDIRGRLLGQTNLGIRNGEEVFRWNITENAPNSRLRSVVVLSDKPLIGSFWMWNDDYGQINGMQLAEKLSSHVVLPFIPQSYFEMTTSFALQGFSPAGNSSEVSFFLVDSNEEARSPLALRTSLASYGYIIGTPELTISLGGLDGEVIPSWANISPMVPDYLVSGFQTFTREDGSKAFLFQSAASELNESGSSEGHLVFTPEKDIPLRHEIVLTNPGVSPVEINLEVFFHEYEPLIDQVMLKSAVETVTLSALERRRIILGEDLFTEIVNPFLRMAYKAMNAEDSSVPAEIFALHFQLGPDGEMSSANFTQAGTEIRTWLARTEFSETSIELMNVGSQYLEYPDVEIVDDQEVPVGDPYLVSEDTFLEAKFVTEDGRFHFVQLQFEAGEYFPVISIDKISSFFGEEPLDTVQIIFQATSGEPILAKVTRRAGNDFAVINPYVTTMPVVEEE